MVVEDLVAEQLEAGAAVHGSFDELDAVYVAFGGAVAEGGEEGVGDGVSVALEAAQEALELGDVGGSDGVLPGVPGVEVLVAERGEAGPGELGSGGGVGREGDEGVEGLRQGRLLQERPCEGAGRGQGGRRWRGCRGWRVLAPGAYAAHDGAHAAGVALLLDLAVEAGGVAAALLPALGEVGQVGVEQRRRAARAGVAGWSAALQVAGDGAAIELEAVGDGGAVEALVVQVADVVVALLSSLLVRGGGAGVASGSPR